MGRPERRAIVSLVAAALLAGCGGGGGSDEQQVRDVVTSFVQAGKDRDAAKACSLLAEDQVKVVQRLGGGGSCEKVLGGILSQAASTGSDLKIEDVRVEGDRATVDATVKAAGSAPKPESILLVKESGEWKLASAGL
jgi:ketosteroid isomerase-like protein